MIDLREFARKQFELTAEFGKYVFDHPDMDAPVCRMARSCILKSTEKQTLTNTAANWRTGNGAKRVCRSY